jgi:RNA-directed DNA polymerase
VRRNAGAVGVDKISVSKFEKEADKYLAELEEELKNRKCRPMPVKRVMIPKWPGQTHPLGIPAVKDRIVQKALLLVI